MSGEDWFGLGTYRHKKEGPDSDVQVGGVCVICKYARWKDPVLYCDHWSRQGEPAIFQGACYKELQELLRKKKPVRCKYYAPYSFSR